MKTLEAQDRWWPDSQAVIEDARRGRIDEPTATPERLHVPGAEILRTADLSPSTPDEPPIATGSGIWRRCGDRRGSYRGLRR